MTSFVKEYNTIAFGGEGGIVVPEYNSASAGWLSRNKNCEK
jgi:hypothetical protein